MLFLVRIPGHWSSKVPTKYKRNAIIGELHRAKKIASDFNKELTKVRIKYSKAGFPLVFINNVINRFMQTKEDLLIPNWFFDERKEVQIRLPFAPTNENFIKTFIHKLEMFTNYKVKFNAII